MATPGQPNRLFNGVDHPASQTAGRRNGPRRSSAVAGYVNPVTGQVHNAEQANTQTLIGAICFLIGSVLLLPARTEEARGQVTAPGGDSTIRAS